MNDLNSVCLCGRLVKDAIFRAFREKGGFVSFSVAVNRQVKQNGEWTEKANFFNVFYAVRTEKIAEFLKKGQQVAIQGFLEQNVYTKNGEKVYQVQINAQMVQLVGGTSYKRQNDFNYELSDVPF